MNSKEKLVEDIVKAEYWDEYSECIKRCEDICSIIDKCKDYLTISVFESYGEIIEKFGAELFSASFLS